MRGVMFAMGIVCQLVCPLCECRFRRFYRLSGGEKSLNLLIYSVGISFASRHWKISNPQVAYADSMEYMHVTSTILQFMDLFRRCPLHISQSKNSLSDIWSKHIPCCPLQQLRLVKNSLLIAPGISPQHSHTSASIRKYIPISIYNGTCYVKSCGL